MIHSNMLPVYVPNYSLDILKKYPNPVLNFYGNDLFKLAIESYKTKGTINVQLNEENLKGFQKGHKKGLMEGYFSEDYVVLNDKNEAVLSTNDRTKLLTQMETSQDLRIETLQNENKKLQEKINELKTYYENGDPKNGKAINWTKDNQTITNLKKNIRDAKKRITILKTRPHAERRNFNQLMMPNEKTLLTVNDKVTIVNRKLYNQLSKDKNEDPFKYIKDNRTDTSIRIPEEYLTSKYFNYEDFIGGPKHVPSYKDLKIQDIVLPTTESFNDKVKETFYGDSFKNVNNEGIKINQTVEQQLSEVTNNIKKLNEDITKLKEENDKIITIGYKDANAPVYNKNELLINNKEDLITELKLDDINLRLKQYEVNKKFNEDELNKFTNMPEDELIKQKIQTHKLNIETDNEKIKELQEKKSDIMKKIENNNYLKLDKEIKDNEDGVRTLDDKINKLNRTITDYKSHKNYREGTNKIMTDAINKYEDEIKDYTTKKDKTIEYINILKNKMKPPPKKISDEEAKRMIEPFNKIETTIPFDALNKPQRKPLDLETLSEVINKLSEQEKSDLKVMIDDVKNHKEKLQIYEEIKKRKDVTELEDIIISNIINDEKKYITELEEDLQKAKDSAKKEYEQSEEKNEPHPVPHEEEEQHEEEPKEEQHEEEQAKNESNKEKTKKYISPEQKYIDATSNITSPFQDLDEELTQIEEQKDARPLLANYGRKIDKKFNMLIDNKSNLTTKLSNIIEKDYDIFKNSITYDKTKQSHYGLVTKDIVINNLKKLKSYHDKTVIYNAKLMTAQQYFDIINKK